jgi:O-6-methylguanine DNA methyltransferase
MRRHVAQWISSVCTSTLPHRDHGHTSRAMPRASADVRRRSVIRRAQAAAEAILFSSVPTPIGRIRIAASETGIVRIELPGADPETRMNAWLAVHFAHATCRRGVSPVLRRAAQQIEGYFTSGLRTFSLPLELAGTPFQIAVWKQVYDIPFGATRSYGAIARSMGNPKAMRAVGAAQGANPIPIVIPCHRVVGSTGALVGYGGGLPTKRWLLEHERELVGGPAAPPSNQLSLFEEKEAGRRKPFPVVRRRDERPRAD